MRTAVCPSSLMCGQELASLLCEDDHVLHDVDRSGGDAPGHAVPSHTFQKQTGLQVEPFLFD